MKHIRKDFPYLTKKISGYRPVYFDSAATSQKPTQVIRALAGAAVVSGNVHRGIHQFSQQLTARYEAARAAIGAFLGAQDPAQVIFTKNATEAINLVVWGFAAKRFKKGDTVLLTEMEHHSNLVPWLMLAKRKGVRLEYVKITGEGRLDILNLKSKILNLKPKIFSFTHASNVLGTINPVGEMVKIVKKFSPKTVTVVDGAQAAPHLPVNFTKLGADFYAISGHKMLGPTGIGALVGRREMLEQLEPVFGGGDMIRAVSFKDVEFNDLPWRLEPGTPPIIEAIAFGEAINYFNKIGMKNVVAYENQLKKRFLAGAKQFKVSGLMFQLYGPQTAKDRTATFSFNVKGIHAHDLASLLNENGIAIRSGHHCAQPLMGVLGTKAAARVSLYIYNTAEEIDYFFDALAKIIKYFGGSNGR